MNTTQPWSAAQKRLFFIVSLIIIPFSGLCVDLYVPSLPAMTHAFHTSHSMIQLTIAIYSFGMAITQIIAGPIADKFGRKNVIISASIAEVVLIFFIIHSTSIEAILVLRFLQGVLLSLVMVPARAISTDIYTPEEYQKCVIWFIFCWGLGPIIAPFIGGYLQDYFGWQANFYFMLAYACLIALLALVVLRETIKEKQSIHPRTLIKNYSLILRDGYFVACMLCSGLLISFMLLFNLVAPFLVQKELGYSAIDYGHIALGMGFAWFLGSFAARLVAKYNKYTKIAVVFTFTLIAIIVMGILSQTINLNLPSLIIPAYLIVFAMGVIFPIYAGTSIPRFAKLGGTANGLFFAGSWLAGSIALAFGSLVESRSLLPLAVAYFVMLAIATTLQLIAKLFDR